MATVPPDSVTSCATPVIAARTVLVPGGGQRAWAGGLEQREPVLGQPYLGVLDDLDRGDDQDAAEVLLEGLHDVVMGPFDELRRRRLDHGEEQAQANSTDSVPRRAPWATRRAIVSRSWTALTTGSPF